MLYIQYHHTHISYHINTSYHLRNCRQLLNTVTLVLTWHISTHQPTHTYIRCIDFSVSHYSYRLFALHSDTFILMDNSGKVWLIRTRHTHTHTQYTHMYSALNGKLWFALARLSTSLTATWETLSTQYCSHGRYTRWADFANFTFAKHVIQASTASSHRVGKCIFEPSKQ